jgi:Rrf2 family protein
MQMRLGKRTDYAIRAVLDLARHESANGRRKSRQIAETMDIPEKYLPQVLAALVHAGLVDSETGPDGGYRLAVPAGRLSLLQVVEAVEGPITSAECVLRGGPCHWEDRCAVHERWAGAQDAMRRHLDGTTFADLAAADEALERARS